MLEERYNNMMESVGPSPELVQRTVKAARPRRRHAGAWKPALVIALCVVMVVGAAAWRVMHTPETSSPAAQPTPTFLPISDELTLSVSDVTLVNERKLSFILTVRGDQVDSLTNIDYRLEGLQHTGSGYHALTPSGDQPPNEQRYQVTLQSDVQPILKGAADTLQMSVIWYTTGDTHSMVIHDIDWSTVTATELPRVGSPLIPLGGEVALTALAYTEEDGLSVQLRWPSDSWETTHSMPQLIQAARDAYPEDYIRWSTMLYTEDGWTVHNTTFQVSREELDDLRLITYTDITGRVITGDWRISIDLTELKAN